MDPRWLESFIALAETGSIRMAASRLGISPATLSDRISALEEYLGVSLFNRDAAGSTLSDRGEIYLSDAAHLLESWNQISTQTRMLNDTPISHLRMVIQGHLMPPPPLDDFLKQFLLQHYHVIPEMYDDREFGIEEGLHSGKLDLFFAFCPDTVEFPGISHRTVYTTHLCALVPFNHRLAKREAISLSDLDGETLLLSPETKVPYLRTRELDALQAAGIRYFPLDGHFNPRMQDLLVGIERGIAILPHSQCFPAPGVTAVLPLTDPNCQCSMKMFYLTDNANPVLWQFLSELDKTKGDKLI